MNIPTPGYLITQDKCRYSEMVVLIITAFLFFLFLSSNMELMFLILFLFLIIMFQELQLQEENKLISEVHENTLN